MAIFLILTGVFVLVVLLYLVTPRGTILHEVLHLPAYWLQLYRLDTRNLQPEKIQYGQHPRQYFIFVPPPTGSKAPEKLIIYFHGGGWKFGRPENFTSFALPFQEEGLPVVLPSIRRTPGHNYYGMREDLSNMLLAVLALQQRYGWKNQQIVLGGMSAGGNLAALLYFDEEALQPFGLTPGTLFQGLFVCGAPLDLAKMRQTPVLRAYAGKRNSDQFQAANPVTYLNKSELRPVLCIHGDADGMVAYSSACSFCEHFSRRAPNSIRFIPLSRGTHLDAASWSHSAPELKREILSWMKKL